MVTFDAHLPADAFATAKARSVDLDTLFRESDVVSLHAPPTSEARHMVNAARLASLRQDAVIVNTVRCELVGYEGVVAALRTGTLGGAGLDVLEAELN